MVTLNASGGDTAMVMLTETGVNTGIFTASIPTQSHAPVANDGILQTAPGGDLVSAIYVDGIDASYNMNLIRSDSLYVISLIPNINLVKRSDPPSAQPGMEITYAIHYKNLGMGTASNLIIIDTVPMNTTYATGSLRMGGGGSTYDTATPLTDTTDIDAGEVSGTTVTFIIPSVASDDGIANSGPDEGIVYFKVKID